MTLKIKVIFPALLAFGTLHAQYTEEINSNRPGMSQSAFAVGKTIAQVEAGINGVHEQHSILNSEANGMTGDLAIRYGAFDENLEFMVDMQYRVDQFQDAIYTYNRNDFSRFTFGAKYLAYDPNKYYDPKVNLYSWKENHKFRWHSIIPAIAVYAGFNFMTKNPYTFPDDKLSPKGVVILQNNFGKWVWVNNIILDKIGTTYPSSGLISTITRGFNEKWSGFLEFQAYKSDFYADGVGRVGAAYLFNENMQFDASISGNFKDTPSILYGGVGFSWRFTANYEDVMLPGKGDREDLLEEDQKKQQKDKDKRKKEREERKKMLEQEPVGPEPQGGN
jgi:Putative MetA-pathway of phenol degradation